MFVLLLSLLFVCAFIKLYLLIKRRNNHWKERGVPTVKTNSLFGVAYDVLLGRRSFEQIFEDIYKRAGDEPYVGVHDGLKPILFIRDPELIHQITVKDFNHFHERQKMFKGAGRLALHVAGLEGDEWKTTRNKILPTFSGSKMRRMHHLIEECTEMLVKHHFGPFTKTGEPIEIVEIMARYSLDVIGKCAFGLNFNSMNESDSLFRKIGRAFTDTGLKNTFRMFITLLNPNLLKYFGMKMTSNEVENFFFDLLRGAEELRRKETEHRGDFLQLMLDIKDEDTNKAQHLFTEDHIASNMFVFYLAGHEPTSLAIVFALYELAKQPEIQEKLRHEISKAREANNGILDYKTIKNIAYLEMVVAETLRLHSPAAVGTRLCTEDYQVPGSSLRVNAGNIVFYSVSGIQKDERYFSNPLKFDPERFSEENLSQMNPYAYIPWGSGPRICLGMRFAKLEIKICLASVISHFKLTRCAKTEDPIIFKKRNATFHAPENGIWLSVEEI